jgi:hypothetical protein
MCRVLWTSMLVSFCSLVLLVSAAGAQIGTQAQTQPLGTPPVRVGVVGVQSGQPSATPTVRVIGVVSVTQTQTGAPRAGGLPLEFLPPLVAGGAAFVGGGLLLLRSRR